MFMGSPTHHATKERSRQKNLSNFGEKEKKKNGKIFKFFKCFFLLSSKFYTNFHKIFAFKSFQILEIGWLVSRFTSRFFLFLTKIPKR